MIMLKLILNKSILSKSTSKSISIQIQLNQIKSNQIKFNSPMIQIIGPILVSNNMRFHQMLLVKSLHELIK